MTIRRRSAYTKDGNEMKKKKALMILAFALAVIFIPIGVFAIKNAGSPVNTGGGFVRKTIDRLNLTVDKTTFTFNKIDSNVYNVSFTFTAEKTEADFYGVLDSFSVNGINSEYVLFTATDGTTQYVLNNTTLPASNGKPQLLSWTVEIPCKITSAGTVNGSIQIVYTSGVTSETADSRLLEIPLTVTVK